MNPFSFEAAPSSSALVLIVDPQAETRHWMWRLLSRAFGVIEAKNAASARRWITERPDIDAIVVEDELPDSRGGDFVKQLVQERHPIAEHAIVVAPDWRRVMLGGLTVVERGDMQSIVQKLTVWFRARDVAMARRART